MRFECTTDFPVHVYLHFTFTPPPKKNVYKWQRGTYKKCGYKWRMLDCRIFEQSEPGLTYLHTIYVVDWPACRDGYWYLKGRTAIGWQGSQSLVFTDHRPEWADPYPPPAPILVTTRENIARAGNHYTWWANDTWYVVVPSRYWIEVYKLVGDAFVQQDAANRPAAFGGTFRDCDSRLSVGGRQLHIMYTWRNSLFPPDWVCYTQFRFFDDSWSHVLYPESIVDNRPHEMLMSMARDGYDNVFCVYMARSFLPCVANFLGRIDGVWSGGIPHFITDLSEMRRMSAVCDHDNTFHATAQGVYYDLYYRARTLAGETGSHWRIAINAANVLNPSVDIGINGPKVAYITTGLDLRLAEMPGLEFDIIDGPPVLTPSDLNLFITPLSPETSYVLLRTFPGQVTLHARRGDTWLHFYTDDARAYAKIAATQNGPGVISYIGSRASAPQHTYFNGFYIPAWP